MENWLIHRDSCLGVRIPTDAASQTLYRWLENNDKVLVWGLGQIYHFNPAVDPGKNLVSFHVNGDTMQLHEIRIQPRAGNYLFPKFESIPGSPDICCYVVQLDNCLPHRRTYTLCSVLLPVLLSPQSRQQIVGVPNWHYIVATVLFPSQTSLSAANKKLILLREAIRRHASKGSFELGERFSAPPLTASIHLSTSDMHDWHAKFNAVELWRPLREFESVADVLVDKYCPLTYDISTL